MVDTGIWPDMNTSKLPSSCPGLAVGAGGGPSAGATCTKGVRTAYVYEEADEACHDTKSLVRTSV